MAYQYDLVALQTADRTNVALAATPAGHEFMVGFRPQASWSFLEFISHLPTDLRIGVLDPTGKILNFSSVVLH